MTKRRDMSESGMLVYPQLPVPKASRESEPRMPKKPGGNGTKILLLMLLAAVGGAAGGFVLRPMLLEDSRVVDANNALAKERLANAEAKVTITKLRDESKKLDEQRELLDKQLEAAKQAQTMLADKAADATKLKHELQTAETKLKASNAGSVTIEGNEVHLAILDKALFKAGDELSRDGMKVLDKVAAALKELADKQVVVSGHTDDQPPPRRPAPKPAKPLKRGEKAPKVAVPAAEFATNWELSSAHALAVVHYFQDKHKLDASRLSARAFSQYRPASKSNKAANRRVEIVLSRRN